MFFSENVSGIQASTGFPIKAFGNDRLNGYEDANISFLPGKLMA